MGIITCTYYKKYLIVKIEIQDPDRQFFISVLHLQTVHQSVALYVLALIGNTNNTLSFELYN